MVVLNHNHPIPLKHNVISFYIAKIRDARDREKLWWKTKSRSNFKSIGFQTANKIKVSVSRSLKSLERKGLVQRKQVSGVRTDVHWQLTDKGLEFYRKMKAEKMSP